MSSESLNPTGAFSQAKDLKNRIGSVKSTQKITSAMKMVAAAKLRKAQDQAIASRPYTTLMDKIVSKISSKAMF